MRSEAQKLADKRYQAKNQHRYKPFIVNLSPNELERISATIQRAGMKKAEFIRWAYAKLLEDEETRLKELHCSNCPLNHICDHSKVGGCRLIPKAIE